MSSCEKFFSVGLLVIADGGVVADAFHEPEAQPRLHPQAGADAENAFPEELTRGVRVGDVLVERPALLHVGLVAEEIRFEFQLQRSLHARCVSAS